jgi:hypothetical protein
VLIFEFNYHMSQLKYFVNRETTPSWEVCSEISPHFHFQFLTTHHMNTIEELLGRNNSGSYLERPRIRPRDPSRRPSDTLYPQDLVLTPPTIGCRSVGIVRSLTKVTEFINI